MVADPELEAVLMRLDLIKVMECALRDIRAAASQTTDQAVLAAELTHLHRLKALVWGDGQMHLLSRAEVAKQLPDAPLPSGCESA